MKSTIFPAKTILLTFQKCKLKGCAGGRFAANSIRDATLFRLISLCVRMTTSSMASSISNRSFAVEAFLKRVRIRETTSPARFPSRIMRLIASRASASSQDLFKRSNRRSGKPVRSELEYFASGGNVSNGMNGLSTWTGNNKNKRTPACAAL
jgi:hypothetical protein